MSSLFEIDLLRPLDLGTILELRIEPIITRRVPFKTKIPKGIFA